MVFDIDMIKAFYAALPGRIAKARKAVGKPLTLSEKILFSTGSYLPTPHTCSLPLLTLIMIGSICFFAISKLYSIR
jgi:hypothetical protein